DTRSDESSSPGNSRPASKGKCKIASWRTWRKPKRNWNRPDKFATLACLLCTTAQRRPAFLAKLLCGYRNYWFCENGDRLGTALGKARPSRDVQLLSKTGEAGKSCAGVMRMKKSLSGGLFDIGSTTSCLKNGKPA